jgi:uncharacterized Tic20 family protein
MAKADKGSDDLNVEPIEQPYITGTTRVSGQVDKEERKWAMFCHLSGLAGLSPLLPAIGCAVAPLIIWQLKAEEFPFVAEQGRRAVNFQLSMLLYVKIGTIICFASIVGAFLAPIVWCVLAFIDVIFVLTAAVKANGGWHYRYPITIRFFK